MNIGSSVMGIVGHTCLHEGGTNGQLHIAPLPAQLRAGLPSPLPLRPPHHPAHQPELEAAACVYVRRGGV